MSDNNEHVTSSTEKDVYPSRETAPRNEPPPNQTLQCNESSVESSETHVQENRQLVESNQERIGPLDLSTQCDVKAADMSLSKKRPVAVSEHQLVVTRERQPVEAPEHQPVEAPEHQPVEGRESQAVEGRESQAVEGRESQAVTTSQQLVAATLDESDKVVEEISEVVHLTQNKMIVDQMPEKTYEKLQEAASMQRFMTSSVAQSDVASEKRPEVTLEVPDKAMEETSNIINLVHKQMNDLKLDDQKTEGSASAKKGRKPGSTPRARSTPIQIQTSPPVTRSRSRDMRKFPSTPASPARKGNESDADEMKGARGRQRAKKNN